ncbi:hypothetical protein P7K49_009404, partial [Saguinus oedipus]
MLGEGLAASTAAEEQGRRTKAKVSRDSSPLVCRRPAARRCGSTTELEEGSSYKDCTEQRGGTRGRPRR